MDNSCEVGQRCEDGRGQEGVVSGEEGEENVAMYDAMLVSLLVITLVAMVLGLLATCSRLLRKNSR